MPSFWSENLNAFDVVSSTTTAPIWLCISEIKVFELYIFEGKVIVFEYPSVVVIVSTLEVLLTLKGDTLGVVMIASRLLP